MNKTLFALSLVLLAVSGCRRSDIRAFTLDIPALTVADQVRVTEALAAYDGVVRDSLKFDFEAKKLELSYDSMKVAKKNLEMSVAALGLAVNGVTPESLGTARSAAK